jgi:hypothetical protein
MKRKSLRDLFPNAEIYELPPINEKVGQELVRIRENIFQALEKGEEYRKTSTIKYRIA